MPESLTIRYGEETVEIAQQRKNRLNYKKLTIGQKNDPKVNQILDLLFQIHQNYYFGYFQIAICGCGILLEQGLILQLQEKLSEKGILKAESHIKNKKYQIFVSDEITLNHLSLKDLIELARAYQLFPHQEFSTVKALQHIRNTSIHNTLPEFTLDTETHQYKAESFFTLEIPQQDVLDHTVTQDSNEIWAYYTLSRTRAILNTVFEARVKKYPPLV